MELIELIRKYQVEDIEKALILNYIEHNSIDVSSHPFIMNYLMGFSPEESLMVDIRTQKHASLQELAVDMELLIPESDRQTNGAFFTPHHIVDYIIETIAPKEGAKVIDISCGCGAFLLGIIRYYEAHFGKTVSSIVRENLFGADLLEYNVRRSKLLIMLYGLSRNELIQESSISIITTNSLTHKWQQHYDAVIGNPPYVKFQDMEEGTRNILSTGFQTTDFGTYNLYFAFFEIGLRLLNDEGVLGYITPNNFFTSLSGESLRTFFQANRAVWRIVDFNATKVFSVQTYTAITFLSKKRNEAIGYSRIKDGQSILDYLSSASFTENNYEDLNVKKWRLLCDNERIIIERVETAGESIGSLLNIAVGIATLKDEAFFIIPYREDKKYYYCSNKYRSDFKVEKDVTRPLVKISTIKSCDDLDSNKRRIIFPYYLTKGTALPIEEDSMRIQYPECYSYLISIRDVLAGRGKGKHEYTPFYVYGRTQGLCRKGVRIYTPTFSQYPRFILDTNVDSLFTNGYGLYYRDEKVPEGQLFSMIDNTNIGSFENVDVLLKILNSGVMHYYISKTSVSIEGGYPCYQKNFIERFTIPSMSNEDIRELRSLTERDAIDEFLMKLYQIKQPFPNLWE